MSSHGHPLSVRLRALTRAPHAVAQRSGFLAALAAGRLPVEAYAELTAQHWFVYEALESAAAAMVDDPVAGMFVTPELHRLAAIEDDLVFVHGPGWADHIVALPATTTYCTRLRDVAFGVAPGFVAHHYTRYFGDVTGGLYLGAALVRAYGLGADGCRFFAHPGVDTVALQARHWQLLDALTWSRAQERVFLTEAVEAYRLSVALLTELQQRWT